MKAVIQRVTKASVTTGGECAANMGNGLFVLLGVEETDNEKDTEILARKVADLRIFSDEQDKMNLSVIDVGGEVTVVSQFTLCADTKKGNRPSFKKAKEPQTANAMYLKFCELLAQNGVKSVKHGVFGADMKCEIHNDGPVTILLDTEIWR